MCYKDGIPGGGPSVKMRSTVALLLAVSLLLCVSAVAQGRGPSTAEERKRVVDLVVKLQKDPLNPQLTNEKAWAIKWLIDVPDISVAMCSEVLGPLLKTKYKYNSELVGLHTLAAAAFIIQNPDQANDQAAINLGATKSMLAGYDAIVAKDPRKKSPELDEWKAMRDSGELEKFVQEATAKCSPGQKS